MISTPNPPMNLTLLGAPMGRMATSPKIFNGFGSIPVYHWKFLILGAPIGSFVVKLYLSFTLGAKRRKEAAR